MTTYQIWLLDADYTKSRLLTNTGENRTWSRLYYRQAVDSVGSCSIDIVPNSSIIDDIALGKRIRIIRDGVEVYGGIILREGWGIEGEAPKGDSYQIHCLDHAVYADWRVVVPAVGNSHDERTGAADDVAKAYVYYHAGAGAAVARRFSDLAVEANATAAASITAQIRYTILLTALQNLAKEGDFHWRFVPSASGCEFQTKHQIWGTDRTKDNGVNDEVVFSLDRKNVSGMAYTKDALQHFNYLYVAGQGEEENRTVVERNTAADITTYGRRERLVDARHLSLTASLQNYGDAQLIEKAIVEALAAKPRPGGWKDTWDLGDHVTVAANRYGRTFSQDVEIYAMGVEIFPNGVEHATPEMRAV